MKNKVILIAVMAMVITASIFLMVWQRQQTNGQLMMDNEPLKEGGASAAPRITPTPAEPTPTAAATPEDASITPAVNPTQPNLTDPVFSIYIGGKTISIAYGVAENTLDKGPGWLETSALPGQDGMCVIYGHRNRTHLRILQTVEAGDGITATLPDRSKHTYIVTQVTAFEHSDDPMLPTLDGKSIAFITCYPFCYSGSAPGEYMVIGQLDRETAG